MKKGLITVLIVAGVLLGVGICLVIVGLSLKSFHAADMFSEGGNMMERTYELQQDTKEFDISELHGASVDIISADVAKVDVKEPQDYQFLISEDAGTLRVRAEDNRGLFRFSEPQLVLYLPEGEYGDLLLDSSAGYVKVGDGLTFETANVKSTSGSVTFASSVKGDLTVDVGSGSMTLSGVDAQDVDITETSGGVTLNNINCKSLNAKVTSGGIKANNIQADADVTLEGNSGGLHLSDISCDNLQITNTSGGTDLENVLISRKMHVSNTSGGIKILSSDAEDINLKTSSGSIKAEFLTYKDFRADATSGSVNLPEISGKAPNGTCVAHTTSGSIKITVKE